MTQDFWDLFEQGLQEETGSGGGIIGKGRVDVVFKVYAKGFAQEDTFFICENVTKEARDAARAKALKFCEEYGLEGDPRYGIQITLYREHSFTRGQPVTWQKDRYFNVDGWTSAAKEVVVPHLKEAGVTVPFEGWMRVSFAPDPYKKEQLEKYLKQTGKTLEELDNYEKQANGMTDTDVNGNPRLPLVAFVAKVYENEAEAMKAVAGQATAVDSEDGSLPIPPQGLTEAEWNGIKLAMKPLFDSGQTDEQIAATFGLDVRYVQQVRKEV